MQGPLILDRYRPIEAKGEGASGRVDICWDTRIQRRVAIKRMPLSKSHGETIPGLAEARTGALLSRPSIVSVYDFDVEDDEALLIMEAIEGPTLADLLENTPEGTFDLNIAAAILAAVGDAIEFAHENQVLHLDIKPENILITKGGAVKVSDFGVSELADAQGFGKASGGTIGYMPPEQMKGKALDETCDEFALAAVAYEIITGHRPFVANNLDASIKRIEKFDIAAPSVVRDDVNPELDEVLFNALSARPEDRYPSVADFMDALMPYLGIPALGSTRLREIASYEEEIIEEPKEKRKFFDTVEDVGEGIISSFSPKLAFILGRIVSAVLCWWVCSAALVNVQPLTAEIAMLVSLLPALGAAVKPPYGALLTLAINGVALFFCAMPLPIVGVLSIAAAIAWIFVFHSELRTADANCALLIAPLAFVGFAPVVPMITGYFLPPKRAIGAAVIQVVLMLSTGIITGPELLFGNLTNVSTYIIAIGWVASTLLMSMFCSRGTTKAGAIGAVATWLALIVTQMLGILFSYGIFSLPSSTWIIATTISCIIMCVMNVIQAPPQAEGD